MTWPIHEKIQRLLKDRNTRKKDLADSLGIAPQTMTDICKGRSAVTLKHLRGLIGFFGIRANFWLDENREHPGPLDLPAQVSDEQLNRLEGLGPGRAELWERILPKLQRFLSIHREAWEESLGPLDEEEARILGLAPSDPSEAEPRSGNRILRISDPPDSGETLEHS